jgi:hypothetical protein
MAYVGISMTRLRALACWVVGVGMILANDLQRKNVGIAAAVLFGLAMLIAVASFALRLFVNRQSWPNAIVAEILCGAMGIVLLVIAANL